MAPGTPPADLVELGRISGAYGVQGWIKIEPYTAQSEVLLRVREWWLRRDIAGAAEQAATGPARGVKIVKSRTQGATIVAQLAGITDRDQAEALRGNRVWISRAAFPAAQDDEYYWIDLIGCLVYGQDDDRTVLLGRVSEVTDNGAHGVLRVSRLAEVDAAEPQAMLDAKGRALETLIPFVSAHVQNVDLAAKRIDTDWPSDF